MEYKFDYKLTKRAKLDLDQIVSYISIELENPQAASDFVKKLNNKIDDARIFPDGGIPVYSNFLRLENVRKKIVGNYVMYYCPDKENKVVYVLRIVYSRQNMDEVLTKLCI